MPFADSQRLKEAVENQKIATKFEKRVIDFKTADQSKVFRKIKNKLKMSEFSEMRYYQSIIAPHIFRWIFLGFSAVFFVYFTLMIILIQDYDSEADWYMTWNYAGMN